MYCVKCKQKTESTNITAVISKNNRKMLKSICSICGSKKSQFVKQTTGGGYVEGFGLDIHSLIGKLPHPKRGWTLPKHKYTGPWNPLEEQLDENDNPKPGQEPYNQIDEIAMRHDICYRDHEDNKHSCDRVMVDELDNIKPKNFRERFDRTLVKGIIGTKLKLGLGNKNSKNSKKGLMKK